LKKNILNISLFFIVLSIYTFLGNANTIYSFLLSLLILWIVCKVFEFYLKMNGVLWQVALPSYLVLSIIGLLLIINYRMLYSHDFAPYGDDSFYYQQIIKLYNNIPTIKQPTFFEYFMVLWYNILTIIYDSPKIIDIITLNWAIGAFVGSLIIAVIKKISVISMPYWIIMLAFLGNSIITDSLCNFYRDGLMLVMYLLAILSSIKKDYFIAIIFAIICGAIRVANGGFALLAIMLIYMSRTKNYTKNKYKPILLGLMAMILILTVDNYIHLGTYLRVIQSDTQKTTIVEQSINRSKVMYDISDPKTSENTVSKLFHSGPLGWLAMPVVVAFAPFRFISPIQPLEAHIKGFKNILVVGLSPRVIWSYFTIIFWVIISPRIISGILVSFRARDIRFAIFQLFIISLLAITFISFQTRHRLLFLIWYPLFINLSVGKNSLGKSKILVLRVLVFLGIILVNRNFMF
jgi:hypothetical protein